MLQLVTSHTLSVTCDDKNFNPTVFRIVCRTEGPLVVMMLGDDRIELRTPSAHKIGFGLVRAAADCISANEIGAKEFVVLNVNGRDIHLPPEAAQKIGASLLRRSDPADDFQRDNKIRTRVT